MTEHPPPDEGTDTEVEVSDAGDDVVAPEASPWEDPAGGQLEEGDHGDS